MIIILSMKNSEEDSEEKLYIPIWNKGIKMGTLKYFMRKLASKTKPTIIQCVMDKYEKITEGNIDFKNMNRDFEELWTEQENANKSVNEDNNSIQEKQQKRKLRRSK